MNVYFTHNIKDVTPQEVERDLELLPAWRREIALGFKNQLGRVQCVKAYLLLDKALREVWGLDGREQEFVYGPHGKPSLKAHPECHFNLSHSKQSVMCVVHDQPVGCDMEVVRPSLNMLLVRKTMNDSEMDQILQSPEPTVEFARLWTMKEAVVKLTGQGLTVPLHDILVDIPHIHIDTHISPLHDQVHTIAW